MADNQQSQGSPGASSNTFSKGMLKDYNDTFVGEGLYTHARNAVNNSHDGQMGVIGNEPSNFLCYTFDFPLIGAIHLSDDQWAVFLTNDVDCEIGIFDESACSYTKLLNDPCLGFKRSHLITGTFRKRYDCERIIYWDDGLNFTRSMDIDNTQQYYNYVDTLVGGCKVRTYLSTVNCESLRLAPLVTRPCISIQKGTLAGTLPNGSYQACIAYTIDEVKITDYVGLTPVQGLFSHENTSSSLIISITDIDKTFDEFELVILANINAQTVARRIGYYSTSQGTIYVDRWDTEYPVVNVGDVVFRSEPIEKTDAMYPTNDYLLRIGTHSKFRFNYQPLANQITTQWVSVEYPADYYIKGNNNAGYMRDEQYAFFIRFVYNTGEFSDSYHIPGRPPLPGDTTLVTNGDDYFEALPTPLWQVENTYSVTSITPITRPDGGIEIARGTMGYWESTEFYPDNKPEIWNSFPNTLGHPLNLCGQPIRHHKMPDETKDSRLSTHNNGGTKIRIIGVEFDNISFPVDNYGNPILSIVGYEILRSSREGNKTILAKGLLNNMRAYTIPTGTITSSTGGGTSTRTSVVNAPSIGALSNVGLYQNYPYNDLRPDCYLTSRGDVSLNGSHGVANVTEFNSPRLTGVTYDTYSFHGPDITFSNPYLNPYELKIYEEKSGFSFGTFETPYKHPKFKVLTNFADFIAGLIGLITGAAGFASGFQISASEDIPFSTNIGPVPIPNMVPFNTSVTGATNSTVGALGWNTAAEASNTASITAAGVSTLINIISSVSAAAIASQVGREQFTRLTAAIAPKLQYAAQYNSVGFYSNSTISRQGQRRRQIIDSAYVGSNIQQFSSYQINNINRSKFVILKTGTTILPPTIADTSRFLISETFSFLPGNVPELSNPHSRPISSYYGAMKIAMPSQYGQLETIKQIPILTIDPQGVCVPQITPYKTFKTGVLFGGDVYVNRFTEKNSMFFFTNWLSGEPDEIEIDYTRYINIPYPRFWINNTQKHSFFKIQDDYRALDARVSSTFFVEQGFFYLFNSGIRDFFVESEVNVAYRDWEDDPGRRHYDPYRYTDFNLMFRSDIIQSGNYYKYDYSLSISKLFGSHISWGQVLPRDYDPFKAASCYTYRPNRVIYSLPQQSESKKDSWKIYLPNNYKDFPSRVSCIKPINKTGSLFMMAYQSPMSFMGVEELKVDGTGAKITIGDGGLFQQPMQSVTNVDESFEYGSNQGRYCSINTVHGVFWVSQNQGKVFLYANQLKEISAAAGMRWWFARYLPSELLKVYPTYALYDNPVSGVGVQMMYDNTYDIIYITKKDYVPLNSNLQLNATNDGFTLNGTPVALTDTTYFKPASWTISYDCKSEVWISFHDWIPSFLIPGRAHFMSVNQNSIWKHNIRCDSYCNYYGVDYPFEIEFVSATGQSVNSMRSIEYLLEVYNIHNDCRDKFHVLDQNFDQAIIYNSEQISGILQLNLKTKNNPLDMLNYPRVNSNPDYIDIQFSKEENKYRFNQFWDITNNRGEYVGVNIPMFNTEPNGYIYPINPNYINYNKSVLERKKFRHNVNRVFLRRMSSGNNKFLFKISNQKLLQSPR